MNVLMIEDDARLLDWLGHSVTALWPTAKLATLSPVDFGRAPESVDPGLYHLIVFALGMSEAAKSPADRFQPLEKLVGRSNCPPVIVLASGGDELHAVQALRMGAADYIPKRLLGREILTEALRRVTDDRARAEEQALLKAETLPEIDGYTMIRPLVRTRYSTVCLAFSEERGECVAVKCLSLDLDEDDTARRSLEREYELMQGISSSRVARIYEMSVTDERAFIAMEYFAGGDLRRRMKEPLLPRHCIRYLRQICQSLQDIHDAGIVHRDLKPGNIMLRGDDSVALIDFGVGLYRCDDGANSQIKVRGTPYYVSPEQAAGEDTDECSDLYSLGVVFYEMLAGEKPFNGRSVAEVLTRHRRDPVPRLPGTLRRYQPLVDRLLAKDPADRFADAGELLEIIDEYDAYRLISTV